MSRAIVSIVLLGVLAFGSIYAVSVTVNNAGEDFTVNQESWTPDPGNYTVLDESRRTGAVYDDEVIVRDNNGDVVDAGDDYVWNESYEEGTVLAVQGGELDGAPSATITYHYQLTTAEQRNLGNLVAMFPHILGLIAPALIVVLSFRLLGGG